MSSVLMAIVDFIPVVLFCAGSIIFQRDFYNKMAKGVFTLFAAGTMFVVFAGAYKATWKLLYNLGICDFAVLNKSFFPMQATGFFLAAMGIAAVQVHKRKVKREAKKGVKVNAVSLLPLLGVAVLAAKEAPPVYSGTLLMVVVMVTGVFIFDSAIFQVCIHRKQPLTAVLICISFVFVLGMGYLSSKDFEKDSMNWIAECVNIIGQGTYFLTAYSLHRKGMAAKDALDYTLTSEE